MNLNNLLQFQFLFSHSAYFWTLPRIYFSRILHLCVALKILLHPMADSSAENSFNLFFNGFVKYELLNFESFDFFQWPDAGYIRITKTKKEVCWVCVAWSSSNNINAFLRFGRGGKLVSTVGAHRLPYRAANFTLVGRVLV